MRRRRKLKPLFQAQRKRHEGDCGVAALADLLQIPYEEVLVGAAQIVPMVLTRGLDNDEIIKVAKKFGMTLEERDYKDIDFKRSVGILGAKLASNTQGDEHAVVLARGVVYDSETEAVWAVRDYLEHYKATEIDLLELE
jgi:hypothetical protein